MKKNQLTALAVALVSMSLAAQESVGTVTGVVKNASGQAITGARIVLRAPQLLGERVFMTGADGSYRIPLLPPGDYTATVSKDGFVGSKGTFRLGAGGVMRQDFALKPIAQQGTVVEIVASSATIDKTETKTTTNFSIDALQNLPMGNDSYAALKMAPGVAGNQGYEQIRGGLAGSALYQVNGMSVRDPIVRQGRQTEVVLSDSIEDVSVIQSPLNARYGNTSSGLINATTKNGSNTFTGSLRVKLEKESWNALRPGGVNGLGVKGKPSYPGTDDLTRTYEVFLAGPIIKDHLTFAYAGRYAPSSLETSALDNPYSMGTGHGLWTFRDNWNSPVQGYNFGFTGSDDSRFISGKNIDTTHQFKLFMQLTPEHQVEYFYTENIPTYFSRQQYSSTSDATGFAPSGTINDYQHSDRKFYGVNYRGMLSSNSILDVRYGFKKSHVTFPSGGDPIRVTMLSNENPYIVDKTLGPLYGPEGTSAWYWTNGVAGSAKAEKRDSQTIALNYNLILDTASGQHNLDFGFEQLKEITFSGAAAPNGVTFAVPGQYTANTFMVFNYTGSRYQLAPSDPKNPQSRFYGKENNTAAVIPYATVYAGTGADAVRPTNSLYVNDLWTINPHWSVMAGVRYDSGKGSDTMGERYKYTSFSPRFEVKWDPMGDSSRVMNFSYGQFRGTISTGTIGSLYSIGDGAKVSRYLWTDGSPVPHEATLAQVTNLQNYGQRYSYSDPTQTTGIDHDLHPEVAHEFQLGYRRGYVNGAFLRMTAIYRRYADLISQKGYTSALAVKDYANPGHDADIPLTYFRQVINDPETKRGYKGVEVEFKIPVDEHLTLNGNWTYGRSTGTLQFREGNQASGDPLFREKTAALGYNNWNPEGVLPDNRTHTIKAWLTHTAHFGKVESVVSLLGQYQSGTHYSLTNPSKIALADNGAVLAGIPQSVPYYYGNRGAYTFPDFMTFDLQYNLTVPIRGKLQFFSALSINNLLNHIIPQTTTNYNAYGASNSAANRSLAEVQSGYMIGTAPTYGRTNDYHQFGGQRHANIDVGFKF